MRPARKSVPAAESKSPARAPVWSKKAATSHDPAPCIAYCAGRDVQARPPADLVLVPHDLATNRAHNAMLCRVGIIPPATLRSVIAGLDAVEREWRSGGFTLDPALEDVHINIERAVAAWQGEAVAGVMHTARSRNDQTATDIRLWLREALLDVTKRLADAVAALSEFAAEHAATVMAGWTHGQPAMPMTLGHWAASHGFALARDLEAIDALWPLINRCPLGAAAGFGTSWPIDRKVTAAWLGFDGPVQSSLDAVSTRWECEARAGSVLAIMMTHLSSLGQDLIHLSSPPRRFVDLDPAWTTGSSIMPQKRNPDFAEVTRARTNAVQGLLASILNTGRGALSGYNRDSQWTKYWIMDLLDEVGTAPEIFAGAIRSLRVNAGRLRADAEDEFASAVDLADYLASSRGVEFRRIYHVIGEAVMTDLGNKKFLLETLQNILRREMIEPALTEKELQAVLDPGRAVTHRKSPGGPSPAGVRSQSRELAKAAAAALRRAGSRSEAVSKARIRLDADIRAMISSGGGKR